MIILNLYFLHADGHESLVQKDVTKLNAIKVALEDLKKRNPKFESHYQRAWDDNYGRYWIDVGSWSEFYILHDEYNGV